MECTYSCTNNCLPNSMGVSIVTNKLRIILLNIQNLDTLNSLLGFKKLDEWYLETFFQPIDNYFLSLWGLESKSQKTSKVEAMACSVLDPGLTSSRAFHKNRYITCNFFFCGTIAPGVLWASEA